MGSFGGGGGKSFSGRGSDADGPIEAIPPYKMRWGNDAMSVTLEGDGLSINVGAASLCDAISTALVIHHSRAIIAGRRPGGSSQAKLDPEGGQGKLAAEGKRPNVRGFTGKAESLPNVLTRSAMRVSTKPTRIGTTQASGPRQKGRGGPRAAVMGTTAHANIEPANALHAQWLIEEEAAGREYFSVVGDSDRVITKVVVDYLETAFDGENRTYEKRRFQARDVG